MSDVAIKIDQLSKCYRIGTAKERYVALRDVLTRRANDLWRLIRFKARNVPRMEDFWALKNVSFDVRQGECVGIIGRNGAGKSTLLKILSRITEPTKGEIRLRGCVGSLLEVGTGFHPELSGRENIFLNGAFLGMRRQEILRKFDEIVAFAEVPQFLDTPVKYYSSGMYTRLAFAVAAHLQTEILIVDEVLAVGDAEFQRKCLAKMSEVSRGGRTVLFVSHNMAAVQQLCSKTALLRSGHLHSFGETKSIVLEYLSDAADNESGQFDMAVHPARHRLSESIIRRITLSCSGESSRARFRPTDSFVVNLSMVLPHRVREPRIAIAIEDAYGRRITTAASYFNPTPFPEIEGEVVVCCTIPRLDLGPGRYLISASIGEKNQGLLDSIDAAAWFTVEWDNNYGTGEGYNPVYGPVLYESTWNVLDSANTNSGDALR